MNKEEATEKALILFSKRFNHDTELSRKTNKIIIKDYALSYFSEWVERLMKDNPETYMDMETLKAWKEVLKEDVNSSSLRTEIKDLIPEDFSLYEEFKEYNYKIETDTIEIIITVKIDRNGIRSYDLTASIIKTGEEIDLTSEETDFIIGIVDELI